MSDPANKENAAEAILLAGVRGGSGTLPQIPPTPAPTASTPASEIGTAGLSTTAIVAIGVAVASVGEV